MTCLQSLAWLCRGEGIRHIYSVISHCGRCSTLAVRRQWVKQCKGGHNIYEKEEVGPISGESFLSQKDPDCRKRECRSWGCGLMWGRSACGQQTAQLPGAVEAGKSSWSLPSALGCVCRAAGAERLCFSRGELVPQHLWDWAVQTPVTGG